MAASATSQCSSDVRQLTVIGNHKARKLSNVGGGNRTSQFERVEPRIGDAFQIPTKFIPSANDWTRETSVMGGDCVWDAKLALASEDTSLLEMIVPHDRKEATLTLFHRNNYRIEGILDQIMNQKPNHGMDWSVKTKQVFSRSLLKSIKKDFAFVSRQTRQTVGDCQSYYYASFKQTSDYAILKRKIRKSLEHELDDQSSDECVRCKEVGNLICCSICQKSFHLSCCTPPLVEVPVGEWYCEVCDPNGDKAE